MRIVKEAEVRKEEILDVAEKLFERKGFDETSTGDILNEVGIARGTLYYHFKSKEDILDGVIGRITNTLVERARNTANEKDVPLLQRLTKTLLSMNVDSKIGDEILEQVHRPQNALMHQKIQKAILDGVIPILSELVEEGKRVGIFHTNYSESVVEMIIIYANTVFDGLNKTTMSSEEIERKISGFIYNIERLLGMEEGSLKDTILPIFQ